MKLTAEDQEYFKKLGTTDLGKWLSDYCERVSEYCYYSKDWKENETRETADMASRIIKAQLVDKIRLQNPQKPVNLNQYI